MGYDNDKRRAEERCAKLARNYIYLLYKSFPEIEVSDFEKSLLEIKDRLSFQNLVIQYLKKFKTRELRVCVDSQGYEIITSEKEWKDFRGRFLYIICTDDFGDWHRPDTYEELLEEARESVQEAESEGEKYTYDKAQEAVNRLDSDDEKTELKRRLHLVWEKMPRREDDDFSFL